MLLPPMGRSAAGVYIYQVNYFDSFEILSFTFYIISAHCTFHMCKANQRASSLLVPVNCSLASLSPCVTSYTRFVTSSYYFKQDVDPQISCDANRLCTIAKYCRTNTFYSSITYAEFSWCGSRSSIIHHWFLS